MPRRDAGAPNFTLQYVPARCNSTQWGHGAVNGWTCAGLDCLLRGSCTFMQLPCLTANESALWAPLRDKIHISSQSAVFRKSSQFGL